MNVALPSIQDEEPAHWRGLSLGVEMYGPDVAKGDNNGWSLMEPSG